MGLTDKFKNTAHSFQQTTKTTASSLIHIILRLISGFFIGFVLSLVFQELFSLGNFALVFLTVLFMSLIFSLLSKASFTKIIVFDVICILIGALLRMYILIAPY